MKTESAGLWLVIYITASERAASAVERLLTEEGFLVRARHRSISGTRTFEMQVLESEAREARNLLVERGY